MKDKVLAKASGFWRGIQRYVRKFSTVTKTTDVTQTIRTAVVIASIGAANSVLAAGGGGGGAGGGGGGGGGIFSPITDPICNVSDELIAAAPIIGFAVILLGFLGMYVANRDAPGWVVRGILVTAVIVGLGTGFAATVGSTGCP